MSDEYSRAALLRFLDMLAEKGLANGNTAQSFKVAVGKILVDLSEAEEEDVRKVDVALAIRKFNNKNPGVLSPSSLAEYQRRVTLSVKELGLFVENPTIYKGIGSGRTKSDGANDKGAIKKKDSAAKKPAAQIPPASDSLPLVAGQGVPTSAAGLSYAFPLRQDFLAQLVLPRDMRNDEANRLCAFIRTLASDFAP